MKIFRHIGFRRILPEYLLFFGLLLGSFSISGTLAECPISQAEVAYIELISQEKELEAPVITKFVPKAIQQKLGNEPFDFKYFGQNHAFLIHHFQAQQVKSLQKDICDKRSNAFLRFSRPFQSLYPQEDFSAPLPA